MRKIYFVILFVIALLSGIHIDSKAESSTELTVNKMYTINIKGGTTQSFKCTAPYGTYLKGMDFRLYDVKIDNPNIELYNESSSDNNSYSYYQYRSKVTGKELFIGSETIRNPALGRQWRISRFYKDKRNIIGDFCYYSHNPEPMSFVELDLSANPGFSITYKIKVVAEKSSYCEKESNNSFKKANKLRFDLSRSYITYNFLVENMDILSRDMKTHYYCGKIKKKDVDYYKLVVPKSGRYRIFAYIPGKRVSSKKYIKTTIYNGKKKELKSFESHNHKQTFKHYDEKNGKPSYLARNFKKGDIIYVKIQYGNTSGLYIIGVDKLNEGQLD